MQAGVYFLGTSNSATEFYVHSFKQGYNKLHYYRSETPNSIVTENLTASSIRLISLYTVFVLSVKV